VPFSRDRVNKNDEDDDDVCEISRPESEQRDYENTAT
jgi:hypothetical protein